MLWRRGKERKNTAVEVDLQKKARDSYLGKKIEIVP